MKYGLNDWIAFVHDHVNFSDVISMSSVSTRDLELALGSSLEHDMRLRPLS